MEALGVYSLRLRCGKFAFLVYDGWYELVRRDGYGIGRRLMSQETRLVKGKRKAASGKGNRLDWQSWNPSRPFFLPLRVLAFLYVCQEQLRVL